MSDSDSEESIFERTWNVNEDIPQEWTNVSVRCSLDDIPANLKPGGRVTVPSSSSRKRRRIVQSPSSEDSDEEESISDEEGDWKPEGDNDNDMSDEELDDLDEDEPMFTDSDDDPGWIPTKKKPKSKLDSILKKKTGKKPKHEVNMVDWKQVNNSSKENDKEIDDPVLSDDGSVEEDLNHRNLAEDPPSGPCTLTKYKSKTPIAAQPQRPSSSESSSAIQPEPGDFLIEVDEVKDGYIPFLWRYKRGGLIQKYMRFEENNKVLFQNCLNFSDWWSCYAHKFVPIEMTMLYKYRTLEKVAIKKLPELDGLVPQTVGQQPGGSEASLVEGQGQGEACTDAETSEQVEVEKDKETENESETEKNSQNEEVTSTTTQEDEEFQTGMFVIDKKDMRNVDNFPIWRIENGILLKKYQLQLKSGKMIHKPLRVYRGYRNISSQYNAVKIKPVRGDYVEVEEESRPKLFMDVSTEEQYEKNPLLRHFYVYLQVFLSQALEPGFLREIYDSEDPTYVLPLTEIDRIIEQKQNQIERKVRWNSEIQEQLQKCPYLREVAKPDQKKQCQALQESSETVEEQVFLFGDQYDHKTLKPIGRTEGSHEFSVGRKAAKYISIYHQVCHFKYNLYDNCLAKVKVVRDSKGDDNQLDVEEVMDECLGNKQWVLQNFDTFLGLIQNQN